MTIGGVHFRTGDDADIQADMNIGRNPVPGTPLFLENFVIQFILC